MSAPTTFATTLQLRFSLFFCLSKIGPPWNFRSSQLSVLTDGPGPAGDVRTPQNTLLVRKQAPPSPPPSSSVSAEPTARRVLSRTHPQITTATMTSERRLFVEVLAERDAKRRTIPTSPRISCDLPPGSYIEARPMSSYLDS